MKTKTQYRYKIKFEDQNKKTVEEYNYITKSDIEEDLKGDLKHLVNRYRYTISEK